jgi:uncharacterized membrane protein YccF (DUF307 family)
MPANLARREKLRPLSQPAHGPLLNAGCENGTIMKTLLNVIWLVLSGIWLFLGYMLAALIMCVLIVTIPWGIAAARIGVYALWPFGKTVVDKPTAGVGSFLGNVVWVVLAGWWIALTHLLSGIALCLTIIGIPFGIANFKLISVALMPLGKQIVDTP